MKPLTICPEKANSLAIAQAKTKSKTTHKKGKKTRNEFT